MIIKKKTKIKFFSLDFVETEQNKKYLPIKDETKIISF